MNWIKIVDRLSVEQFSGIIAPVIPGATVLMLLVLHHPNLGTLVLSTTYLGYRTKIFLVIAAAMIAGWTATTAYLGFIGFCEGALGPVIQKWLQTGVPAVPPWRNKTWRALVTQYLGAAAPEDLDLISEDTLRIQIQTAEYTQDPRERFEEVQRLKNAKGKGDIVDHYWQSWWDTLHYDAITKAHPAAQIALTIESNLQTASVLILCALPNTPILNQWWLIASCVFWLTMRVLRTYSLLRQTRDPWSSFTKQMDYLRSHLPSEQSKAKAVGT